MPKVQTYLCVFVVILHSVCASSESSIDYDALNSQIDAFTASLDAAYPTFNYNNIASEINSLASGLTKNDITITPLPNYSSYIQTAQPEETLVTPSVFVSDIIKSQSNYLATRSSQQTSSPSQAASTSFTPSTPSSSTTSAVTYSSTTSGSLTAESPVSTKTVNGIPFVGLSSLSSSANTGSESRAQSSSSIDTQSGLAIGSSASFSVISSATSQLSTTETSTRQNLGGQAVGTSQTISTAPQSTSTTSTLRAKGLRLSSPGRWSITMGILLAGGLVFAIF